jgi:hypothetical protein
MLNKFCFIFLFVAAFNNLIAQHHNQSPGGYADSVNAGIIKTDTMRGSPHRVAMANIGDAHIHIE